MNALEALTTRASSVGILSEPAPDEQALATILKAAQRAPDHGHLRPWRFFLVRGQARERFGQILGDALNIREPHCSDEVLKREQSKAMRAPLIIVVAAKIDAVNKIPVQEQVLAVGAAAQNILVAAYALGFGAVWKTGAPAYDRNVKAAFGLTPDDEIVGFLYVGTQSSPRAAVEEAASEAVTEWKQSLQ